MGLFGFDGGKNVNQINVDSYLNILKPKSIKLKTTQQLYDFLVVKVLAQSIPCIRMDDITGAIKLVTFNSSGLLSPMMMCLKEEDLGFLKKHFGYDQVQNLDYKKLAFTYEYLSWKHFNAGAHDRYLRELHEVISEGGEHFEYEASRYEDPYIDQFEFCPHSTDSCSFEEFSETDKEIYLKLVELLELRGVSIRVDSKVAEILWQIDDIHERVYIDHLNEPRDWLSQTSFADNRYRNIIHLDLLRSFKYLAKDYNLETKVLDNPPPPRPFP